MPPHKGYTTSGGNVIGKPYLSVNGDHLNGNVVVVNGINNKCPEPKEMAGSNVSYTNANGTIFRSPVQSDSRIPSLNANHNHIGSPITNGLLSTSTTLSSPTLGPNFNSTQQTLLDITQTGPGLTPPGLVTSSSSTTAIGQQQLQPQSLHQHQHQLHHHQSQGSRSMRNGGLSVSRISGPGLTVQPTATDLSCNGGGGSGSCGGGGGGITGELLSPAGYTRVKQQSSSDLFFHSNGVSEMLSSLALMCLLSLLMAFLALFFLQRTGPIITIPEDLKPNELPLSSTSSSPSSSAPTINSPPNKDKTTVNVFSQSRIVVNTREYVRVFQISVSLSTLTISLNLCCLFVCCIQFLSTVKLLKTPQGTKRAQQFLKKTSHVRITAIGAFLLSIPIFFTGVILFTFINFDETPALITSIIIGIGIVFCGLASVQNVYLWQAEKTRASKELSETRLTSFRESAILQPIELSTLV